MNQKTEYSNLTERQQKEFLFQVIQRLQYVPNFYEKINNLLQTSTSPFEEVEAIQILKPEFSYVDR